MSDCNVKDSKIDFKDPLATKLFKKKTYSNC